MIVPVLVYCFSITYVAEWPLFGKVLLIRLTDVLFVLYLFVILVVSHFGFEGGTFVLIAPVPGHCLPFTFSLCLSETLETGFLITGCI